MSLVLLIVISAFGIIAFIVIADHTENWAPGRGWASQDETSGSSGGDNSDDFDGNDVGDGGSEGSGGDDGDGGGD